MTTPRKPTKPKPRTKKTPKGQLATIDRARDLFIANLGAGTLARRYSRGGVQAGARTGQPTEYGYRRVSIDGRFYFEHVVIYAIATGWWPADGWIVHHRNEIRDDNRFDNLELKRKGNHTREHKISKPGTAASGAKNIYRDKRQKRYRVSVMAFGIRYQPTFSDSTCGGRDGAYAAAKKAAAVLRDERQGPLAEGRHVNDIVAEIRAEAAREAREAVLVKSAERRQSRQQVRRAGGARKAVSGRGRHRPDGTGRRSKAAVRRRASA